MSDMPEKKESSASAVAGLAAVMFGLYAGSMLLIPLLSAFVIGALYAKFSAAEKQFWQVSIAVQGGHAIWFIVGLASLGVLDANAADPLVLIAGVAWLYFRPGFWPVAVLGILQLLGAAYNTSLVLGTEIGSAENKALLVHIVFRLIAVGAMAYALFLYKKRPGNVAAGAP